MAYIFNQDELPKLVSVVPGRERVFFVDRDLAGTDDMAAGIMRFAKGTVSPYHFHDNCDHFYLILEGKGLLETSEGSISLVKDDLVFIGANDKHRLTAAEDLTFFECKAPNHFKTNILEGSEQELKWRQVDGNVWVQS
ncbi:MAG: cupin domain-containing protein [Rhodospirillales bacterium]|nr:cupin domain-containing protein [Rhodospirillales bacterium]